MEYKYKEHQLGAVVSSGSELTVFSRQYYWEGKEAFSTLVVKWTKGEWETTAPVTKIAVSLIQWVVSEWEEDNKEAEYILREEPALHDAFGGGSTLWWVQSQLEFMARRHDS